MEALKKGTFQHVESELLVYNDTIKEILKVKNELLKEHGENTASQIMKHRMLEQMERITDAIENIFDRLPNEKKKLIELRYWTFPQLLTWDGIAIQLKCDRSTAIRWRNEIISEISKKLGWR